MKVENALVILHIRHSLLSHVEEERLQKQSTKRTQSPPRDDVPLDDAMTKFLEPFGITQQIIHGHFV